MAFTFAAFAYIAALILTAVLIFFAIWHLIAFDELQHDYKNPVDQCNSLNPLVLPEYGCHIIILLLMICAGETTSVLLNLPLLRILYNYIFASNSQEKTKWQFFYSLISVPTPSKCKKNPKK